METEQKETKLGLLNLMVLILSVYVLIALIIDTVFQLPLEIARILNFVDNGICVFFLWSFLYAFTELTTNSSS